MSFYKLPENSRELLNKIVDSDNPSALLDSMYEHSSQKEKEVLRGILSELKEYDYVSVFWADNKPYSVTVSNKARTYEEKLAEYEDSKRAASAPSITIGNHNKIVHSTIANTVQGTRPNEKARFYEKHPILCGIFIALVAGIILSFSFWEQIIRCIEGFFM